MKSHRTLYPALAALFAAVFAALLPLRAQIGSQPADQSERSMRLFAQEVMPALKAHDDMIAYKHAAE